MATLFRCSRGHLWEDLLDSPTLVEGQVRCPECGSASLPHAGPPKESRPSTLLCPSLNAPVAALSNTGPTRQMNSVPLTDPLLSDETPQPSAGLATLIKPALPGPPFRADANDIEVATPPRGPSIPPERTSEIEVAPFFPLPGEITHTAEAARPPGRNTRRDDLRTRPDVSPGKAKPDIPGYEILDELGRGGMGVVYKARQKGLNRIVALKMILAGSAADERERGRFKTEAEAIARLQHPNIVQIFEVGDINGSSWFSLEFVDGGSLADRLKGDVLPMNESARLVETLARAVHFAHQHGVVHRDLKPANVLLQKEGQTGDGTAEVERAQKKPAQPISSSAVTAVATLTPKITDFGLAKTLDTDIHHTRSGMVVGTPGYMAPEQAQGGDNVGPATDTYSLGVILYQMVTGKLPFVGESPMEVMLKVTQEEPPRPRKWQPRLAADLETIILKCLEKDPKRRYASALDLGEDLRRFLAHEPILARPVQPLERAVRWVRRRPAVAVLLAAVLLAGVGLLATLAWYERGEAMRQARTREDIEAALRKAQQSVELGAPTYATWVGVRSLLEEPARQARKNPALADLAARVEDLLAEAKGHLAAGDTFERFTKARDAALFQATLASGTASQAHLDATCAKVESALAAAGASRTAVPAPDDSFRPAQQEEIRRGCYELLLVLADTTAQALPGQPEQAKRDKASAALTVLETAAAVGFNTHAYHLRKARFHDAAGEADKAARERALAENLPPRNDMDFYLVGAEHYRQGDVKKAQADFGRALHKNPGHFWARFRLALSQAREGQLFAARDNLTSCLWQLQTDNRQPELRIFLLRGFVQGQLNDFKSAEADFQIAEAELNKQEAPDRELLYALYNNRAVTYLGQNKFAEAVSDLNRAVKLAPEQYQAYVTLSQVHRLAGRSDLAQKAINDGLEKAEALYKLKALDVGTFQLLSRLRYALNIEGKNPEAALVNLDSLLGLNDLKDEARGRARRDRGHLLYRDKKFAEALAEYDRAVKLLPGDAELERWRGEVLLRVTPPRYEEADKAFTRYLEDGKGAAEQVVYRGRAYARMKMSPPQFEEAVADFTRALGMKGDAEQRSDLYLQRGHAYFGCKAWELAAKDFEAAMRGATPENARAALQGRALARLQMGEYAKAAKDADDLAKTAAGPVAAGKRPEDAWQPLYQAARILAQVSGQVDPARESSSTPGGKRGAGRDERRRYQDAAMVYLQQALSAMPRESQAEFWRETVRKQSALRPLSSHEAYVRLDRRYSLN